MTTTSTDYIHELETTIDDAAPWLLGLPEPTVTWRPAPTAWSIKEIIGHLIDSAANNHARFVRAASQEDLVFPGYAQDEWVRRQQYASAPWSEIVSLWHGYNRHLARVMAAVPADVRYREHARHNLHEIAWRPFASGDAATLDQLMHDYVLHLAHHLAQVRDRERSATVASESV
jgi:hypothetical protein